MSNVLDLMDQTLFRMEQATGVTSLGQCVWVYNRPINMDGLRRFHQHLQQGRLSRHIERSPLPFGRSRWVTPRTASELEVVAAPRPREDFDAWLREQAATPLDAERGPAWHLAVLPFTDGGAGVSLVASHCVADGMAGCLAVLEAACGYDETMDWPAAESRRRWQAVREDARQTRRDIPGVRRAVAAAARSARADRRERRLARATGQLPAKRRKIKRRELRAMKREHVTIPTATLFLDGNEFDQRAHSLGGTSNALLAGFAGRLAQRMGRVAADGSITLSIPVSERTSGDTRANAVGNVDLTVDPTHAAADLRELRAAIKQGLIRNEENPDERRELLPIVPVLPKRVIRGLVGTFSRGAATVVSSNLGEAPAAVNRPDGTDADYVALTSLYSGVNKATITRAGGVLAVLSARVNGQVFVAVQAYQPNMANSNDVLQQYLSGTLEEFALTATMGWKVPEQVGGPR